MRVETLNAIGSIREYETSVGLSAEESALNRIDIRTPSGEMEVLDLASECEDWLRFGDQVDMVLRGSWPQHRALTLCGQAPGKLVRLGLPDLPVSLTARHVRTMTAPKSSDNGHLHGLTAAQVKRIPELLCGTCAVMVSQSTTKRNADALVLVTGTLAPDGNPLVAVVTENGHAAIRHGRGEEPTIHVLSAYGMIGFGEVLEKTLRADGILYFEPGQMKRLMRESGLSLPGAYMSLDGSVSLLDCRRAVRELDSPAEEREKANPPLRAAGHEARSAARAELRARAREERLRSYESALRDLERGTWT